MTQPRRTLAARSPLQLLLAAVVAALCLVQLAAAYTTNLQSHIQQCYLEDVKLNDYFAVSFDSGDNAIDLVVTDPHGATIYQAQAKTNGFHQVSAAPVAGRYRSCFTLNTPSLTIPLSFYLHSLDVSEYLTNDGDKATPLDQEVRALAAGIEDLLDHNNYMLMREAMHRNTAESTNTRVKWWTVAQCAILVAVSVFQAFYVKSLFEVKQLV
ncbi:hypothetical protein GQ42DRAFT_165487 [Ramicandelaber brevisporus]|nr:hypothetical protein GQ42DRAFT_165487 [Ramicandelaber brevisporus]